MPELRLLADERRSAGDMLAAWLPPRGGVLNPALSAIIPSALLAAIAFVGPKPKSAI